MRLIDANALKEALNFVYDCAYIDSKSKEGIASDIIATIDNAPTVKTYCYFCGQTEHGQIEERPQGEWARHDEWVGGEYVGGFYHVNCPCIDLEKAFYSKWRTNFCPNCGLPMQKGGEKRMTTEEAIKYLIIPTATSTKPSAEYLKQKEAYELAIKALGERSQGE